MATVSARPPRRTQAERSASTRTKLLDATVACLLEVGYARVTTTEIAERAGVSRGAQLHHFPTKAELVLTAVEHLFERRITEFKSAFAGLPAGVDRAAVAVDLLWSMVSGPTFYAALELIVAARTDRELHRSVTAFSDRLYTTVDRTFAELFPIPANVQHLYRGTATFALVLMEGLALAKIVSTDDERFRRVLDSLKLLARITIPPDPS